VAEWAKELRSTSHADTHVGEFSSGNSGCKSDVVARQTNLPLGGSAEILAGSPLVPARDAVLAFSCVVVGVFVF